MREEDDHVDLLAAAEGLDRGAAGIAGGRDDDGGALAALASAWSISRARSCIARSLKASVGPWKSSSTNRLGPSCTSGAVAGWRKVP